MKQAWFFLGAGLAVMACEEEGRPGAVLNGTTASTTSGSGAGPTSAGSGGDENIGGSTGPPVFELPCGGESCDQGSLCCIEGGAAQGCVQDPTACLGVPTECNDQEDCEALDDQEVCCAFYDVSGLEPVLQTMECSAKGACSGPGAVRMCHSTNYCASCQPGVAMPDGFQTCGPPM